MIIYRPTGIKQNRLIYNSRLIAWVGDFPVAVTVVRCIGGDITHVNRNKGGDITHIDRFKSGDITHG